MHSWHHHPRLPLAMERVRTPSFHPQTVSRSEGQSPASRRRDQSRRAKQMIKGKEVTRTETGSRREREKTKRLKREKKTTWFPISHMVNTHTELETRSGASAKKRLLAPRVREKGKQPSASCRCCSHHGQTFHAGFEL